jgi:predicted dehydrogenase
VEKIRIGVIGVGFIGKVHIEALRRLGYPEVTAIVSRKQETADALARELSVPKAYSRYDDLFDDGDIDAVHITTVNNLHFPLAKTAMEKGKHVICEKPLAMNRQEGAELLDIARKTGVVHAVCHNMRYYPMVKQAREMVAAGEIGDVRLVHGHYLQDWLFLDTDYNWRLISELSGNSRAVADVGTHWMDMVQHVTGQSISAVFADLTTFIPVRKKPKREVETYAVQELKPGDYVDTPVDTEDHGTIMLRFAGGAKGVLMTCQTCAGRKNYIHFEINGTKRSVEWNGEHPNHMWIGERGTLNGEFIKDPSIMAPGAAQYAGAPCGLGEGYLDTFKSVFSDVYTWIRQGKSMDERQANFPTFLTGFQELSIVEAILESHKKGQWVEVRYGS